MTISGKEKRRLEATRKYLHFEIDREKELDDIVMLASHICETPIALITLMDEEIQFIKAKTGADITEMPRSTSFCTHAIELDEVMVVDDATRDARFAQAPVVANDPHIRFYASANLKSYEGYNVGTICVYDVKPKALSEVQKKHLSALARQVSHIMELDRSLKLLKEQNNTLAEIGQIQSHELRSPVSSILGIMEMIKEDDYVAEREYLLLLEAATKKLDEKIRLIVTHTNTLTT